MAPVALILVLALVLGATAQYPDPPLEQQKSTLLLSLPYELYAGSEEYCRSVFKLRHFPGPLDKLRVRFSTDDDQPLFSADKDLRESSPDHKHGCLDLPVPRNVSDTDNVRVQAEISTADGLILTDTQKVKLRAENPAVRLITWDKSEYRPGDHAHIQLTVLDWRLRPLERQTISEAWVTNDKSERVAQWKDTPLKYGVASFDLHIPEEYVKFSLWTIHVKGGEFYQREQFRVGATEPLPAFALRVELVGAPDRQTPSWRDRTATIRACAHYFFLNPVSGAEVIVENEDQDSPVISATVRGKTNETGCAELDVLVINAGFRRHRQSRKMVVRVTDSATGAVQRRSLELSTEDSGVFKSPVIQPLVRFDTMPPKLERTLKYRLRHDDGEPITNQTVQICVTSKYLPPPRSAHRNVTVPGGQSPYADYSHLLPKTELDKLTDAHVLELMGVPLLWEVDRHARSARTSEDCREVTTDAEGIARLQMTPLADRVHGVTIRARLSDGIHPVDQVEHVQEVAVMTSPTDSYLAIDVSALPAELPCRGRFPVTVLTSGIRGPRRLQLILQTLSRGRVVLSSATDWKRLPRDPLLIMKPEMSPSVRLLVYSQLPDGEVIADTVVLDVEKCLPNQVSVDADVGLSAYHQLPVEAVLRVSAAPHSRCIATVKDAAVEHGQQDIRDSELTKQRAMQLLEQLNVDVPERPDKDLKHCEQWEKQLHAILLSAGVTPSSLDVLRKGFTEDPQQSYIVHPHADAWLVFWYAAMVPLSTGGLRHSACVKRGERLPDIWDYHNIPMHHARAPPHHGRFSRSIAERPPRSPGRGPRGPPRGPRGPGRGYGARQQQQRYQTAANVQQHIWFDNRAEVIHHAATTLDERGQGLVKLQLPEQVAAWRATVVCTSENGLGVSESISFSALRSLFAAMPTLPHNVTVGEELHVPVLLFNDYDSPVSLRVKLDDPHLLAENASRPSRPADHLICIAPHTRTVSRWTLRFTRPGPANVSVTMEPGGGACGRPNSVHPPRDTLRKEIIVLPDGFPQEETKRHFVCLERGATRTVAVELPRPDDLVPHTASVFVTVYGDQLEPSTLNLESEITEPSGGAEPSLVSMATNVYIYKYLTASELLTSDLQTRLEAYIDKGVRTVLRYRRRDGSFSAHGDGDPAGSLWLTVLTMRTFIDASKLIPSVVTQLSALARPLSDSAEWVMRQQSRDGCFYPVGELLHQELRGGGEAHNVAASTAFVLQSLRGLIVNYRLADGLQCLHQHVSQPDAALYTQALVANTYIRLGLESRAGLLIKELLKRASTQGPDVIYWKEHRTNSIFGTRPVADLEMTSYMALSLMQLSRADNMVSANKAITWIAGQLTRRKSEDRFFKSPQTMMASLDALSVFSSRTYASRTRSSVSVTVDGAMPYFLHVDAANRRLHQTHRVKDAQLPARVHYEVTGGCVTMETTLRYYSRVKNPRRSFAVTVTPVERASRHAGSTFTITSCLSMLAPYRPAEEALIHMVLPAGFVASTRSLREQRYAGKIARFGVHHDDDRDNDSVTAVMHNVSRDVRCFSFRIVRDREAPQLKQTKLHVFDPWAPEKYATVEYTPPVSGSVAETPDLPGQRY